jgi:hypothetical protein
MYKAGIKAIILCEANVSKWVAVELADWAGILGFFSFSAKREFNLSV